MLVADMVQQCGYIHAWSLLSEVDAKHAEIGVFAVLHGLRHDVALREECPAILQPSICIGDDVVVNHCLALASEFAAEFGAGQEVILRLSRLGIVFTLDHSFVVSVLQLPRRLAEAEVVVAAAGIEPLDCGRSCYGAAEDVVGIIRCRSWKGRDGCLGAGTTLY